MAYMKHYTVRSMLHVVLCRTSPWAVKAVPPRFEGCNAMPSCHGLNLDAHARVLRMTSAQVPQQHAVDVTHQP